MVIKNHKGAVEMKKMMIYVCTVLLAVMLLVAEAGTPAACKAMLPSGGNGYFISSDYPLNDKKVPTTNGWEPVIKG